MLYYVCLDNDHVVHRSEDLDSALSYWEVRRPFAPVMLARMQIVGNLAGDLRPGVTKSVTCAAHSQRSTTPTAN